jgi:MHS family alpha-ketoglutarate permease-like MFS transporter
MQAGTAIPHHGSAIDARHRIGAIVASSSGNLVEWYDFFVYSFTALYFAPVFFPEGDRTAQLLSAAGVFAVGFLMRPIGSWIFGRLADRHGRRSSMVVSVLLMCAGSLLVALAPGHAVIGDAAPALLLVARLMQGLSVGGEYGTSATYMSEVSEQRHRGFYASFQYVTLIGGQLLALLVLVALQQFLSAEEMQRFGWRIPFALGALAAVVVFQLRRGMPETSTEASRKRTDAGTLRGMLRHRRAVLCVLGITAGGSLAFYSFTTYMQKYLVNSAGMEAVDANHVMTWVLLCYMLLQPLFGALSDRIGRRASIICFGVVMGLGAVPVSAALAHVQSSYAAFALALLALCGVSFYSAIGGLVKAELFPMHVRALGTSISDSVAKAMFGGSAEYVALWFKSHGMESSFFWYVSAICGVALLAGIAMPDSRETGYMGDGSEEFDPDAVVVAKPGS